jgi:hypothetical protein
VQRSSDQRSKPKKELPSGDKPEDTASRNLKSGKDGCRIPRPKVPNDDFRKHVPEVHPGNKAHLKKRYPHRTTQANYFICCWRT